LSFTPSGAFSCPRTSIRFRATEDQTRTFSFEAFAAIAGPGVAAELADCGVLVRTGADSAQFSHHLLHDYLAARHVSELPEAGWTPATLNTISFDASSFDTVALVFEQLDEGRADDFLRRLYDWNLYAAGYALGERPTDAVEPGHRDANRHLRNARREAICLVEATRQRANDVLLLIHSPAAVPFREGATLREVFAAVDPVVSDAPWFLAGGESSLV
jgi:hypothetical protein